jgi:UPF0176 protein
MSSTSPEPFKVAAFYKFAPLDRAERFREPLRAFCARHVVFGTLILAAEGINGTVAGPDAGVDALLSWLETEPSLAGLEVKFCRAAEMPFHRMKVRLKREIVTMGVEGIDPLTGAGAYVEPRDWNALIDDPRTILVDTRNDYEVALGSFAGAINPRTTSFRAFPAWVEAHRDELEGRRVAMFCTGGIRCEKATAYVKSLGIDEVHHLKGGILKYLEDVPAAESRWQGECFVFDERVSVVHGLTRGEAELCRACRRPLTHEDRASPLFVAGVSCVHCHDERGEGDRVRYAERQRQVELAKRRGKRHVGSRPA